MEKKDKKKYIQVKKTHLFTLLLFLALSIQCQDRINKWAIGLGAGGLLYSEKDLEKIGYRFSEQFPRLTIARYMFKNVTIAGSFSQSIQEQKRYVTFDGEIRYDFGTSENLLNVYVLVGGSLIDTRFTLPLVNFGVGGALWVSDNFGLQGQLLYKYNNSGFQSQASHVFASGGIVYRFSLGNKYQSRKKSRTRLWDMKH
ncbi:hypothetical protein [Polaribacter sp. R77954]|uniref:hypothetical protein n=1 Tax=Polaribacter sp. R77954 TaxID=3093870 RepID=UPI0037C7CE0C